MKHEPITLPVTFLAQGGHEKSGTAVGRKGKSLLIAYRIQSGEARERWIPGGRVIELAGDIDTLPRWRSRSCSGYALPTPIPNGQVETCAKCGRTHQTSRQRVDLVYVDTGEVIASREGWSHDVHGFDVDGIEWRETGAERCGYPVKAHFIGAREIGTRSFALARSSRKLADELVTG